MLRAFSRQQPVAVSVDISDRQKILRVGQAWLERLVRRALVAEGIEQAEISILLVDDKRIAAVHDEWLGLLGPTDVITFDHTDNQPPGLAKKSRRRDLIRGRFLWGDIVVSTETATRVSREFGWTPRQELAYYVIHGLLHLSGYDDLSPADRRKMRGRERSLLKIIGLPVPPRTRFTRKR
ncbi:MAG: rRNA maturation RNase YbeY [Planctomycetota bacterium]